MKILKKFNAKTARERRKSCEPARGTPVTPTFYLRAEEYNTYEYRGAKKMLLGAIWTYIRISGENLDSKNVVSIC